jgi:hypothetical protein
MTFSGPLGKLRAHFASQATAGAQPASKPEQYRDEQARPNDPAQGLPVDWESVVNLLEQIKDGSVETLTNVVAHSSQITDQLARLEQRMGQVEKLLAEFVAVVKDGKDEECTHYTPAEFAAQAVKDGKEKHLKERTVQRWCREGWIRADKRTSGRGADGEWTIAREEYLRWVNEGLLPVEA